MIDWLKKLVGRGMPTAPIVTPRIRARFENALYNDENARNWAQVDYLSAKAANNFQIRRTLRNRSRYELSNNPYLFGICNGNADDLISTGPTLQVNLPTAAKRQFETGWRNWAQEVNLPEKLRTLKLAKSVDGEGFLVLKTVRDLLHPVKIYPVDVEADQVTTPSPRRMEELWIDGLILHPVTGRPTGYTILRHHPGDFFFAGHNPLEADTVKARFVLHWFSKWRPGQVRGVPVFTTALDLFNELRSFRRAELQKANLAANLTAVIETESPADDTGAQTPTPFTNIPIDRGTMAALPANTKLKQYQTGGPGATYEMFQQACLGEACRPLNYPLNLALGTSQKFNFSSARLDHINYRNGLKIERADCDAQILDKLLAAYIEEAALVPGLLPWGIESIADLPHEWHWPGFEPLDPVKDALADHSRIANGTLTWQEFWASRGKDWQDVLKQQALERDEIERFKLVFSDPMKKTQTETIDATDGKEGRRAA